MDYMWNLDIFVDDNTLSVNVTRLRKKIRRGWSKRCYRN